MKIIIIDCTLARLSETDILHYTRVSERSHFRDGLIVLHVKGELIGRLCQTWVGRTRGGPWSYHCGFQISDY